jgi:cytochrome c-type biogenesis protein CcsB
MISSKLLMGFFFISSLVFGGTEARRGFDWDAVGKWAIQERGRVKPIDTFATETVLFVTGRRSWRATDGKKLPAVEILFSWLFRFDLDWEEEEFIRVDYSPLKKALNLDEKKQYFSPKALRDLPALRPMMREIMAKEQRKEKLNELEQKVVHLQNQKGALDSIMAGQAMTILPHPKDQNEAWLPISALTERAALPYPGEATQKFANELKQMMESYIASRPQEFNSSVLAISHTLRNDLAAGNYPSQSELSREVHYNHLRPFRWAWILYTMAFIFLVAHLVSKNTALKYVGMGGLFLAFAFHVYGFVLRCLIAGRPPVTNMYESVVWVTWGCVLFSFVIWAMYKTAVIPAAAAVFAVVGLVIADNLPNILDPGIHPLEPVLRSNMWLTIHVLTITLSYAAFALSLCLGNVVLGNYLLRPERTEIIQAYSLYMYRAIQIGVVLLAAGTILGGVWADYSWGRFWGWDPKEVWALIALLLYLAVLHGRFTGWLRGFGFVATTVVSFLGVLMAWYGVNFVLGVGLHSYGFGSGGLSYVSAYVAAQIAFIFAAYWKYSKSGLKGKNLPIFPK